MSDLPFDKISSGRRAETDERRTYQVDLIVPAGANDADMVFYCCAALDDYGPFIGLSDRLPHSGGVKLEAMKLMEDNMARLRGRSASVRMDLPREVEPEDVASFLAAAIENEDAELLDDDPMKGVVVRVITFDGEKFEPDDA